MSLHITPKYRDALRLTLIAQDGRLVRSRGGFARREMPTSGIVTSRTANAMQGDGLVEFDQPMFPTAIWLTAKGVEVAEQLREAQVAKVGAA